MTKVEHLQPESLRDNQSRYSHVVKAGNWVLIAGQGPADVHGNIPIDPADQVDNVSSNLAPAIQSAGGRLKGTVKTTT